jgi:hypothetical protein
MSQVNTELGFSATAQLDMNNSALRSLAGVPSGQISMSNLQGKSNVTNWGVVIDTTTNSPTFPAGIRAGDAVFSFIQQAGSFPSVPPTFFNTPFGTRLAGYEYVFRSPQTGLFVAVKNQVSFIQGTGSLSGTPVGSGGTSFVVCRYTVFRRTPDNFNTATLSFLGTEVTTLQYPSQSVAYTGTPSVILGMATASEVTNNAQTVTIGGVAPTLIAKNANTQSFSRLFYRANITPATLTTVGTQNGTTGRGSWRPFVVS